MAVVALWVALFDHAAKHRLWHKRVLVQGILAYLVATGIGFLISAGVDRLRPAYALSQTIIPIGHVPNDASFPSAHTWTAFALACVFLFHPQYAKLGRVMLVAAFLVGIGRIMAGMHYPSDVIVGALLGAASAYLIVFKATPLFHWLAKAE